MRNTGVWPAIVLAALALAALPARAGSQEDVAQMQAGTRAWTAAYNAGRVEPILALYGPDAVVMPPDAPLAAGADAIRAWATADVAAAQAAHLRILPTEGAAGVAGDLGWNSGVFKIVDASGSTVGTGKFVEVWRRDHGQWRMIRDIWNNDPAPAAR